MTCWVCARPKTVSTWFSCLGVMRQQRPSVTEMMYEEYVSKVVQRRMSRKPVWNILPQRN
jgi:hypothetical protein